MNDPMRPDPSSNTIRRARRAGAACIGWLAVLVAAAPAWAAGPTAQAAAPTRVALDTSAGRIVVELRDDKAPKTVANFVQYVNDGFYDGTVFHRVISGFMIQGGGFTPDMVQKPTRPPVPSESNNGLKNARGTIAMARTADPNSATAQFFINVVDNGALDYPRPDGFGYTVFGTVAEGLDVVDKIKSVPTGRRGSFENVPLTPVVIKTARIVK
jgi:peptidyl-prolyl cis-trans isomerase A (cyclophilin A)